MFSLLTGRQKESLITSLNDHKYSNRENIVQEGEHGYLMYIVKSGTVICTQKG
jgi:CRP-like cAMP-binding protein